MKMSLAFWLVIGIPENISLAYISFIISKAKFSWRNIVFCGLVLALSSYIIRLLPVTFGVHTIFAIGLLFFLLNTLGQVNINKAVISSIVTILILIIIDTLTITAITSLFEISNDLLLSNTKIRILVSFPHIILLFLFGYLFKFIQNKKLR
jgi:hypothetical protein